MSDNKGIILGVLQSQLDVLQTILTEGADPPVLEAETAPKPIKPRLVKSRLGDYPRHGLTPEQREVLTAAAGGICESCGLLENLDDPSTVLVVDHCHTTGDIRGVICHRCNITAGFAQDNIDRLMSIVKYLEKFTTGADQ